MSIKIIFKGLVVLALLALVPSVHAQKIGAKAGVNAARLSISGNGESIEARVDNMAVLVAPTYGLYLNYKIVPLLSLQIEGNYDPRGNKFDSKYFEYLGINLQKNTQSPMVFDGEISEKLNYLTFPVMLKANLAFFHLEAGPYVGILLNAKSVLKGTATLDGQSYSFDQEADSKPYYKSTDFGLAAGAGMTFNLGPAQLMAGARYMMGMTNIVKEPVDDASAKHQVLSFYAGVAIGL